MKKIIILIIIVVIFKLGASTINATSNLSRMLDKRVNICDIR
jgi:hypothetical protein